MKHLSGILRRSRFGWVCFVLMPVLAGGCGGGSKLEAPSPSTSIDLQGHRGARGLLPENTIPSFLLGMDLGVNTLEMDVVVTSDNRVVASHEPWFSHEICSKPDGSPVTESEAQELNIYRMTYSDVSRYDCGIRGNERFPDQQKTSVSKPLLSAVIDASEAHAAKSGLAPVAYNVEIKSKEQGDDVYHPKPDVFARLVYDILREKNVLNRSTIQSFDPRTLEAVHRIDVTVTTALLVDNDLGFEANLERLSFRPPIYSPNQRLVDKSLVQKAHAMGIKVIPWTVNEEEEMRSLLSLDVDGLITDYPDRGRRVVDAFR